MLFPSSSFACSFHDIEFQKNISLAHADQLAGFLMHGNFFFYYLSMIESFLFLVSSYVPDFVYKQSSKSRISHMCFSVCSIHLRHYDHIFMTEPYLHLKNCKHFRHYVYFSNYLLYHCEPHSFR